MARKKMTTWFSLESLLDRCEREGMFFRDWDGNERSIRGAIKSFANFCMLAGVEFTDDEDFNIHLRMEKMDSEEEMKAKMNA